MAKRNPVSMAKVRDYLKRMLSTNDVWAKKALVRIYGFQTNTEKHLQSTREFNEVGFTGVDGEILSSFAEHFLTKGWLSPKQMVILRKKMQKYWRQIWNISDQAKLTKMILAAS